MSMPSGSHSSSASSPHSSLGAHGASSRSSTVPPLVDTIAAATAMGARDQAAMGSTAPAEAEASTAALTGVRQTAEYRAAWDLELWKAIQAERFRVELDKQKTLALAELKQSVQEKQKRLVAELRSRREACAAREAKVTEAESALAQNQAKVKAMEADLRRMRQQLLDAQARVEEEVRAQVRRANDDIAHKAKLLQERVAAAEAQARRAEERQKLDQAEYLNLYEAFSKFRTEQLSAARSGSPSSSLAGGEGSSGVPDQNAALTFYLQQIQQLRAQHTEDLRLTQERLSQRYEARLHEVNQRCQALEEQNKRLTAALARRREQLHRLPRTEATTTTHATTQASTSQKPAAPQRSSSAPHPVLAVSVAELVREVTRLRAERATLLAESGGALQPGEGVVRRLDARIDDLEGQLAARLAEAGSDDDENGTEGTAVVAVRVR